LEGFPFKIPMFEWGGEQHPQGEPECGCGPNFRLKKMKPYPPDGLGKMPADYQQVTWLRVMIEGEGVDIYGASIEGLLEEDSKYSLEKLLQCLLADQSIWVVLFMPDFDQLDEWIPGDINIVLDKLKYSLTVEKTGYVIWNDKAV
ncbi:hypothetical protein, partial [Niastella populi]|uniref:hypothetical protein n=1 Tax=Niastella populi TaxID=550983 RepID=UPI0013FDD71C